MCNIFWLEPKQMPTKEQVYNCVYNNWHSLGAIIRHSGDRPDGTDRLEVIHHVPESGELDPKMVYELMQDNIDCQRVIHVRHNTAGKTSLENCHPFEVFKSDDEEVWFMHNGTLYSYKETNAQNQPVDDGPSDSLNFAKKILVPIFQTVKSPDINDQVIQKVVNKFWAGSNRGILISRTSEKPWLIDLASNPWKKISGENGSEFISANDSYFQKVERGPEFDRRREDETRKKILAEQASKSQNVSRLADFSKKREHPFHRLSTSPADVLNDWEFYDRAHAVAMGYLTRGELKHAMEQDKEGFLDLCDWLFTDYAGLFQEYEELEGKLDRASKMIATMKANRGKNVESIEAPKVEEQTEEYAKVG